MEAESQQEREVRAARNQSLFRTVNENLKELNQSFATVTNTFAIACECANRGCAEMIEIHPHEYLALRIEPTHFAVVRDHVFPEVERVVREAEQYVVVEKQALAAEIAEELAPDPGVAQ
jgi:5-bromo-4-chloroindolyl phosphate hydrolysis protein